MLYLIGLGLGNETDITVRGLNAVKKCKRVFLEMYTSILGVDTAKLEAFYGRKIEVADRECVESRSDMMMEDALESDVAVLVVGDPFGATTHTDFYLRAVAKGIKVHVIHNASIMNAVGCCGLHLYHFGKTVSLCFWSEGFRPTSSYDKVVLNSRAGMHTLCLLDIKVKEPDFEARIRGVKGKFLPPRYMTAGEAVSQLMAVEAEKGCGIATKDSIVVAVARVGHEDQAIVAGRMEDVARDGDAKLGGPLHSLVVVGSTDHIERGMLGLWWIGNRETLDALAEEKVATATEESAAALAEGGSGNSGAAEADRQGEEKGEKEKQQQQQQQQQGVGTENADEALAAAAAAVSAAKLDAASSSLGVLEEAVDAIETATSKAEAAVQKASAMAAEAAAAIRAKEQEQEQDGDDATDKAEEGTAADGLDFANADPLFGDASSDDESAGEED